MLIKFLHNLYPQDLMQRSEGENIVLVIQYSL